MARRLLAALAAVAALLTQWWLSRCVPGNLASLTPGATALPSCYPCRRSRPDQQYSPCSAPAITIVGNVTIDIVDGKRVLGGAVSYAAAVAAAWGQRACIVTAAADDAPLGATFEASLPPAHPACCGPTRWRRKHACAAAG